MEARMTKVIDSVDKNWDKDIIMRYLISNLNQFFRRDLNFYLRSEDEQAKILNSGIRYNGETDVICKTISEFYSDIFRHFGINAKVAKATNSKVPLYGIVVDGTSHSYFIDPLFDLMPSQFGVFNENYGITPLWTTSTLPLEYPYLKDLTNDYIRYLDAMIKRFPSGISTDDILDGYAKDIAKYIKYVRSRRKMSSFEATNYGIEFINEKCINIGNVDGMIERHKMYNYLFRKLFEGSDRGTVKINIYRDYDEQGNPINPRLVITVNHNEQESMYVESKENNVFALKRTK